MLLLMMLMLMLMLLRCFRALPALHMPVVMPESEASAVL
jgi:hypothetical protein